jgi:hypothetical protein
LTLVGFQTAWSLVDIALTVQGGIASVPETIDSGRRFYILLGP